MSYQSQPPQPTGSRWTDWATRLNIYLNRVRTQLQHRFGDESADTEGVILYDPEIDQVVVSRNNIFEPLAYGHNNFGSFYTTATHSADSINTAYALTWENTEHAFGIEVDDTVTSRINILRNGVYQTDCTVELLSSNASAKSIYIWHRVNGVDVPYSSLITSIDTNGTRLITSHSEMFEVEAGDYLETMFAVTDTALSMTAAAATAFAPAAPSATFTIAQIR
jgi:hypothetical protein